MGNIDFRNIPKICHSIGGVKVVKLTPQTNIKFDNGFPETIDESLEYTIAFRKYSCRYSENGMDTDAGTYIDQELKFYIPKKRFDVDYIISQLLNNRVHVIYNDNNSDGEVLVNAKLKHNYDSGRRKSDSNGYVFTFKSKTVKKFRNLAGIGINVPIGDDQNAGSETGTIIDDNNSGENNTPPFYVKINPVQLNTTPTETGNTTNLNKFVTGADGNNYFIDHLGVAMKFKTFPKHRLQLKLQDFNGNIVTVPNVPISSNEYYWNLNGERKTLAIGATPEKHEFTRDGNDFEFYRLTSSTILDLYF